VDFDIFAPMMVAIVLILTVGGVAIHWRSQACG
jgi:hypothetical protein